MSSSGEKRNGSLLLITRLSRIASPLDRGVNVFFVVGFGGLLDQFGRGGSDGWILYLDRACKRHMTRD